MSVKPLEETEGKKSEEGEEDVAHETEDVVESEGCGLFFEENFELGGRLFLSELKDLCGPLEIVESELGIDGERFSESFMEEYLPPLPQDHVEAGSKAAEESADELEEGKYGGRFLLAVAGKSELEKREEEEDEAETCEKAGGGEVEKVDLYVKIGGVVAGAGKTDDGDRQGVAGIEIAEERFTDKIGQNPCDGHGSDKGRDPPGSVIGIDIKPKGYEDDHPKVG